MGNVKQFNLVKPHAWGHLRPYGKRTHWKAERQAYKASIAERLEDVYTYEEYLADICVPGDPCPRCLAMLQRQ